MSVAWYFPPTDSWNSPPSGFGYSNGNSIDSIKVLPTILPGKVKGFSLVCMNPGSVMLTGSLAMCIM